MNTQVIIILMTSPGRPTLYKPEYAEEAHGHCLAGATNADLADVFEVAPRTIDNWIANIPEFAKAVREGRAVADARVARSLYERAVGYQHTVEQTVLHRGVERKLTNTVHYPPDTGACIFWLRNRRRDLWGNQRPANDGALSDDDMAALDAASERARLEGD
jgi:hypothetical protein